MDTVVLTNGSATTPDTSTPAAAASERTNEPKLSSPTLQESATGTPSLARSIAALEAQPPTCVETESTYRSVPGVGIVSAGVTMTSVVTLPIQRIFFNKGTTFPLIIASKRTADEKINFTAHFLQK